MEQKTKFYKKSWFAILLAIFIYPIGMILVWTNKTMSKKAKIITTVLGAVFFIVVLSTDTAAPEITLKDEAMVVYKDESISSEQLISSAVSEITDNRSEMELADITVEGLDQVDFSTEGEYKVNFIASDQADNEAVVPYTISVELSEEQIAAAEEEAAAKEAEEAAAKEAEEAEEAVAKEAEEAEAKANRENEKALKSANNYIKIMAFSEQGLRGQLEFEGFDSDQIDYAIDNVEVDWNEEAVQSATSYSDTLNMSSTAIYDQLIFEGFTAEQAQYGIDNY